MLPDTYLLPLGVLAILLVLALPVIPAGKLLLALVVGRSLTELGASSGAVSASSALSAALGAVAIAAVFLPRGGRIHHRLQMPILLTLLVLIIGSTVRMIADGFAFEAFREAITLGSILAIFVLAFTFASQHLDTSLRYLLWCSFPAALISLVGFYAGVPLMIGASERLNGTFNHANTAGAFLALSALLAVCLAINLKRPRLLLIAAVSGAGLVATQSIGAWIGVIAACAVYVIATSTLSGLQKGILIVVSSVGSLLAINSFGLPDRVSEFVGFNADSAIARGVATNSLDWRLLNWHLLIVEWQDRPWFGHGLGATSTTIMPLGAPPHSLPIQLLVEVGIVGCAIICCIFIYILGRILAALRQGRWEAALLLALATFVLVNGSESNLLGYTPAMYLIALACGVLCASMSSVQPRHRAATAERVWRRPWRQNPPPPAHSSGEGIQYVR